VTDLPLDTGDGDISSAKPGQELVVIGSGYAPFSSVTITVYSTPQVLATVTADEKGAFRESVKVPANLSTGTHSFVAAGVDSNGDFRALRLDVTVAPAGDDLPVTGAAVLWLIVTGFAVLLAGLLMTAIATTLRRRARS
jgi:hypothetical protein